MPKFREIKISFGKPLYPSDVDMSRKPDGLDEYQFFVNERIELLVREAETFRNDYRNKEPRHVFLALEKPIPLYDWFEAEPKQADHAKQKVSKGGQIETMKFCGFILLAVSFGCCFLASWFIRTQNRRVR